MKRLVVEFLGTFFLMFAVGQTSNPLAVGMMLMAFIYIAGHISGGHFNPAVTLAVLVQRGICATWAGAYMIAQTLGAGAGVALISWWNKQVMLPVFGLRQSVEAMIFELLLTFVLCLIILTVTSTKKFQGTHVYGLAIGLTLMSLATMGAMVNPALAIAAFFNTFFKAVTLTAGQVVPLTYSWITLGAYVVGPLLGGVLASFCYGWLNCECSGQICADK